MVILITQNRDGNTARLASEFARRGHVVRILKFGMPARTYSLTGNAFDPTLRTEDGSFSSRDFEDEIVLLMRVGLNPQNWVRAAKNRFALREWNAALSGLVATWERRSATPWLLGVRAAELKDRKLFLLQLAQDVGADVPDSLLQTSFEPRSVSARQRVAKAINAWEEIRPGLYYNTRLLRPSDAVHLEAPAVPEGPIFLQDYISHSRELRIYLAGSVSFAVEIESRDTSKIDFRLLNGASASARTAAIPGGLEAKLRRMMSILGIDYCVFDVIPRGDKNWVVDVNPLGIWDYLENDFNLELTAKIVDGALSL